METKEQLLKELRKLIKDVPEEGLIFLTEQANKLVYNKRVEEMNALQAKINKKSARVSKKTKPEPVQKCSISVERGSFNRSFILIIGKTRKTITEEEMVKLVRICHIAKNAAEGSSRLYNRLKHERDDILLDVGIGSKEDKCLTEIYKYLKANFSMAD
ncbi:MAG: hypothetical protein PF693_20485 [Spirochaetia bacterium]|jgi:hypothetical protein|nr:hypothetical protein [Spirochaetia bacterium]